MVRIYKASLRDAKGVVDVLNSVIAEGNVTTMDKPFTIQEEERFIASMNYREALFVAEINGKIVGVQGIYLYSVMNANNHVATMGTWILKDYRGKGIGKLLAQEAFNFAKKSGFEKIFIWVMAHNERALNFYRELGFKRIGIAKKQVKLGENYYDEVYMEKFL